MAIRYQSCCANYRMPSTTAWKGGEMSRKVIDIRLFVVGLALFFVFGCASTRGAVGVGWGEPGYHPEARPSHGHGPPPHAPAHGYRAKHCYRYYPANEVYYDTGRRIYFYMEGGAWVSDALLPYHLRVSLGNYETVEMYSDKPYRHHHKYRDKGRHHGPPGHADRDRDRDKF